jgi:hypothetical protein
LNATSNISTPFNILPNGDARHHIITAMPREVISTRSLNASSPSIVPLPAKTSPFMRCMNDDIAAGRQGGEHHCDRRQRKPLDACQHHSQECPPRKDPVSHLPCRFAPPPAARADGTNAVAVPCIPRWHTTPRLYICIVMPPAAQQHGKSSLGGGLNSPDHCILYQLVMHGAKASSAMDVAAASLEGPDPFDRNDRMTHHDDGDDDYD